MIFWLLACGVGADIRAGKEALEEGDLVVAEAAWRAALQKEPGNPEALYGLGCGSCKNCIKRERLDVHIAYLETRQGYQLKLDVNAAYGSGWYDKPRDNGYHDIQLERPADLKKYADRLSSELYTFLSKP